MDNNAKLRQVFAEALQIDPAKVVDSLEYNSIPQWDSVAHMALVASIGVNFDIMLDTDDVIDLSSFAVARKILGKYGVTF